MNSSQVLTRFSIPAILVAKVLVLGYIFLGDKVGFYLGDKKAIGAESTDQGAATAASSNPAVPPAGGSTQGQEATDASSEKQRRSFLDDLLNLPKINTDELKKDELGRYMTLIERKQTQIENRLQILRTREEQLKNLEGSVDQKIKKLEEELLYFQQTLQKEKQTQGDRLNKLVEFYQKMEPKKAAPVFEKLDRDLVVSLFNSFPQKQTTQILALMNPDRSVELSEYYGRIRSGKEYELLKEVNLSLRKEFEDCKGLPSGIQ